MADPDSVFRVLLRFEIKPGLGSEFEQAWRSIGGVITDHPANLGQWLAKGTDEEDIYYVISDWVDEPHFREFEHSDAHVEHRKKLHPFRTGGAMHTMTLVCSLVGAAA